MTQDKLIVPLILSESQEGANVAEYLDLLQRTGKIHLYSHLPHETYTTSWAAKRKNKIQGVKSGVPDYIVIVENKVLFIELKRQKKSYATPEQKEWIARLEGKETHATIAHGFDEAKEFIDKWL